MRSHRTHRLASHHTLRRTTVTAGLTSVLMVSGFGYAGLAFGAGTVSADDSRATVVQGNINACPAGFATLVDSSTTTTTQNGVTVTVSHLATDEPNPFPAGGVTTLPAGTAILNVTLPAGTTLNGFTAVKGGDGYNQYDGQYLTNLIPPVSNGGQIAGLSHFFVCGTLTQTQPTTGSINVKKDVNGSGPGSNGTFKVEVDCGAIDQTLTLSDGQDLTVDNIPDGTSCTVTETDTGGADSTSYTVNGGTPGSSAPTFTVNAGDTDHVVVTNTYVAHEGSIKVTKEVVGTLPSGVTTFPIDVNCAGTITHFDLADGDSGHVHHLPVGTHCTVTETNSDGATVDYEVDGHSTGSTPQSFTIKDSHTSDVDITNTFTAPPPPPANGSITVNKVVSGTGTGHDGPFTVTADCGADGTFVFSGLVDGSSQTQQVPAGATCTVTETDSNGATTITYQVNSGATSSTAPSVGVVSGQDTRVTVSNAFPATPVKVGALHVHKTVDRTRARYGQDLTYTLRVTATGQIDEHNVKVTDVVPAHTTFVSASCDSPCTTSGPTAGGVVTWDIGTLAAGDSVDVTMAVNITTPPEKPADRQPETIPNVGLGASDEHPNVPSNKVHTRVIVVQPLKIVRTPHKPSKPQTKGSALPFTGFDANSWGLAAILMVTVGAGLSIVGRRRPASVSPVDKSHYPTASRYSGRHRLT
jgi:uncharacterized repeat protein (TIGR01451 family)